MKNVECFLGIVGVTLLCWSVSATSPGISCYQSAWESSRAQKFLRLAYVSNGSCATVESRHDHLTGQWYSGRKTITFDSDVEMITIVFDPRTYMSRRYLFLYNSNGSRISTFSNGPYDEIVTIPGNSFRFDFSEYSTSDDSFGLKFYALGHNSETYGQDRFYQECSIRTPFDWVIEHSPRVSVESAGDNLQFKAELELPWCRPDEIDLEFDLSHLDESERVQFDSRTSVSILSEEVFVWTEEMEETEEDEENSRQLGQETMEEAEEEATREMTEEEAEETAEETSEEGTKEMAGKKDEVAEETAEETSEEGRVEVDPSLRKTKFILVHDFPRRFEDFRSFCDGYDNLSCYFTINAKVAGQIVKFWRITITINNNSIGSVTTEVDIHEGREIEEESEVSLPLEQIGGFIPSLPPPDSYKINDDAFVLIDAPTEFQVDYIEISRIQISSSGTEMDVKSASEIRWVSNIRYIARVPLLLSGRVTITVTALWYFEGALARILNTNDDPTTSPDTEGEDQEQTYTLEIDVESQGFTDPEIIQEGEESENFPVLIVIAAVFVICLVAIVSFFCYKMKKAKLAAASETTSSSATQRYLSTKAKEPQTDTEQEEFAKV